MTDAATSTPAEDFMPLMGIDHVEYYVGNARQAAYFYTKAFGFRVTAYAGPETKVRDRASWVCESGEARYVFTGAMGPESFIAKHAFEHGAEGALEPTVLEDEHGKVVRASIEAYGDTLHSFIERENYSGPFLPGYRAEEPIPDDGPPVGIRAIDHIVCNVELGKMNEMVEYYSRILGFGQLVHFRDDQISSEFTALMSKVMWDGNGRVKFPINEPAPGKKKSQIEEYLDFYRAPGVQHIAMATDDVIQSVSALRARGVRFTRVPQTYYEALWDRIDKVQEDHRAIEELGILA